MALTPISTAPQSSDFTALSAHQEQTPATFFSGPPVLHLQSPNTTLHISKPDFDSQEAFASLVAAADSVPANAEDEVEIFDVDVWVTSRYLAFWSPTTSKGLQIPYQSITVTAQLAKSVLLELNLSDPNTTADEDIEHLQIRLTPTSQSSASTANGAGSEDAATTLYTAIGDCQELNPDPNPDDSEEEDEGFDETAPGATGWITSENMHEFVDEDGNFKMPEGVTVIDGAGEDEALGEGAGRVRRASEVDGVAEDGEDGKWQRTG